MEMEKLVAITLQPLEADYDWILALDGEHDLTIAGICNLNLKKKRITFYFKFFFCLKQGG